MKYKSDFTGQLSDTGMMPSRTRLIRVICNMASYGPPLLCLVVLLTVASWHIAPRSSRGVANLVMDETNGVIKAEFKGLSNNPDGSVDLIFRVSRSNKTTTSANSNNKRAGSPAPASPAQLSHAVGLVGGNSTASSVANRKADTYVSSTTRTAYPLTLDADFVINTLTLCPLGRPVDYLIIVHSATAYFERRRAIRETYAGKEIFGNVTQRVVFLLGMTSDPVTTRSIQQEAMLYGDIVQGRFHDSYHNLTHKGVMGFRWAVQHCAHARLIIKIDDDVFINSFKVADQILPTYAQKQNTIACHLRPVGTSVIERGKTKWKVHEDEFKGHKHYPVEYCNGYFVIITADLLQPLLRSARLNPFFWIDDVYLFGVLPATVGSVDFINIKQNLTTNFDTGKKCVDKNGVKCPYIAISQFKSGGFETLWYTLLSNLTQASATSFRLFDSS